MGCGVHPKDAFIARAAVTRDHRLGGLHRRHFFLITAPREEAGRGGTKKGSRGRYSGERWKLSRAETTL